MLKIAFFTLAASFFSALIAAASALAAAPDCQFAPRKSAELLISNAPRSVIGVLNCYPKYDDVNVFLVAKITKLDESSVRDLVVQLADHMDPTGVSTELKWASKQALEKRQYIVRTAAQENEDGEVIAMSHYAFVMKTKDGYVLLLHSMDEHEARKARNTLDTLNRKIPEMILSGI